MDAKQPTLLIMGEEGKKASATPAFPEKIGPYPIESLLEKGGMSVLYLAIDPQSHEPLIVKVLAPEFISNAEAKQRFLREAEIISLTNHPSIIKLYGQGEWEGGVYIATEFVQGLSLRQFLLQESMFLQRALEVILQVGYALTHLHAHGVIHRDLKPENILITATGGIKVIDFGISQLHTEPAGGSSGKVMLMGTPVYMAPEQRTNPNNVSFSSDIYSLAIIAYELVLGRLSYGKIHLSLMPVGLQPILEKALQPDPTSRYQDIVDFISDISKYLESDEVKKERRSRGHLSESLEHLREARYLLSPRGAPLFADLEIGFGDYDFQKPSGLYYDFFSLAQGGYAFVMGQAAEYTPEAILYAAMLRGMVRATFYPTVTCEEFAAHLNDLLLSDTLPQKLCFLTLFLKPGERHFEYVSCGYGPLWLLRAAMAQAEPLPATNAVLGAHTGASFTVGSGEWEREDRLITVNFPAASSLPMLKDPERLIQETIGRRREMNAKQLADAVIRTLKPKMEEQPLFSPIFAAVFKNVSS